MKTAKLGTIFLVSIMALAGIGAGYAMWSSELSVKTVINTGTFMVGVRDYGTADVGPHYLDGGMLYPRDIADPDWTGVPEVDGTPDLNFLPGDNSEYKNVASTISTQGTYYFTHDTTNYYTDCVDTISNAYPWYRSAIYVEFFNGGTIPAEILDGYYQSVSDPDGLSEFLVIEYIEIYENLVHTQTVSDLNGYQIQLEPEDSVIFKIFFYFEEENAVGDIMPQNAHLDFTYIVEWAQWNEVP